MEEKKTLKEKIGEMKTEDQEKANQFSDWCKMHREAILVLVPVLVSGTVELVKVVAKSRNTSEERRLKENFIYDRSNGHYYELKRQPKASEWALIDYRKGSGEYLGDILSDMKILK